MKKMRALIKRSKTVRLFYRLFVATRRVLKDENRKSLVLILYEFMMITFKNKEIAKQYFWNMQYHRDVSDHSFYLSRRQRIKLRCIAEASATIPFFVNKVLFQHYLDGCELSLPKMIGYNVGNNIVCDQQMFFYDSPAWLSNVLAHFCENSRYLGVFIKPIEGESGYDTFKVTTKDLSNLSLIKDVFNVLKKQSCIIQYLLEQHPVLDNIYPYSVNTIRIISVNIDDDIRLISSLIRFGAKKSYVDNASQGGFFVGIDMESGRIKQYGKRYFECGAQCLEYHPDTGVKFEGIVIPFYLEAKELLLKAATKLPANIIGWDVAITPVGPVIIEGNQAPYMGMSDMAEGGLFRHQAIQNLLKQYEP